MPDEPRFPTRETAGRELAGELGEMDLHDPVVVAVPRGGVPVAAQVARGLGAPLDVLDVHEITAHRGDLGVGSVRSTGESSVHASTARSLGMTDEELQEQTRTEEASLATLFQRIREVQPAVPLGGRTTVVVDDGLLVEAGAVTALDDVRRAGAERVVLAVPVGVERFVDAVAGSFDDIVCLERSPGSTDLGDWYGELGTVTDEQIIATLEGA